MSTDQSFSTFDPVDFPVLRTAHSPFHQQSQQQQQQQQQLQQLQMQQVRAASGYNQMNAPTSAPILSSSSAQNLFLHLTSSAPSVSSTNLVTAAANMMLMMNQQQGAANNSLINNNSNTNLAQFNTNLLQQQQHSFGGAFQNQTGSSKMWSNFNQFKDNSKQSFIFLNE